MKPGEYAGGLPLSERLYRDEPEIAQRIYSEAVLQFLREINGSREYYKTRYLGNPKTDDIFFARSMSINFSRVSFFPNTGTFSSGTVL